MTTQPGQTPPPTSQLGSALGVKLPSKDDFKIFGLVDTTYVDTILRREAEQFSAIELAEILRGDSILGDTPRYSIVSDITDFKQNHNPTTILTSSNKGFDILSSYQIDLSSKIPDSDYLEQNNLNVTYSYLDENNQIVSKEKSFVYVDSNGDIVIELNNMNSNEIVEVQFDTNGTIYKVT